jgi:hypothetical protein
MPAEDLQPVAARLAEELHGKLQAANSKQDECIAASSDDEEPALLEGDLFVKSLKRATRIDALKVNPGFDKAVVEASLSCVDERFPPGHCHHTISWTDAMQLRKRDDQWRNVDIHFEAGQSLVAVLDDCVQVDCRP